jgi:hypothetical protein
VSVHVGKDGTWVQEYTGPYVGLSVQTPETLLPDNASPAFNNFMLRNAEARSRPRLINPYNVGSGPAFPQLGITTFVDLNGTFHTVIFADFVNVIRTGFVFQFQPSLLPLSPWTHVGQACNFAMLNNTVSYRTFANTLWWTGQCVDFGLNRINPFLSFWDGINIVPTINQTFADTSTSFSVAGISLTDSPTVGASLPGSPTVTGPLAIGAQFLGELNNQLILANVSVLDQGTGTTYRFPNLIWWSANGLPKQWDPTQNTSAGFNPFLDVPDLITGLATLGVAGYIFRTNGITQFAPIGNAVTPFRFDHMWASDHGIGNVLPFSIAQYGPTCAFVAIDDIYTISISTTNKIGGNARDAIFVDIAAATATPFANIVPIYKNGFVYLEYILLIPLNGFVRMYAYSFEDKNWSPWDLGIAANPPAPALTCAPNVV